MEVSGQLHAPATLSTGTEPPVPILYESGWALRVGLEAVAKTKIHCPRRESKPVLPACSVVTLEVSIQMYYCQTKRTTHNTVRTVIYHALFLIRHQMSVISK